MRREPPSLPSRFTVGLVLPLPLSSRFTVGLFLPFLLFLPFHCRASSPSSSLPVSLLGQFSPLFPFHCWARKEGLGGRDTYLPTMVPGRYTRVYALPGVIYACLFPVMSLMVHTAACRAHCVHPPVLQRCTFGTRVEECRPLGKRKGGLSALNKPPFPRGNRP